MDNTSTKNLLQAQRKRITPQRVLLMELIRSNKGHMDADELHRLARKKDPRLSLSTVYRTLKVLKEMGVVEELHFAEEHHHYEIKPDCQHYHLVCGRCGQVSEFESPRVEQLKEEMAALYHFTLNEARIDLIGLCQKCRGVLLDGR